MIRTLMIAFFALVTSSATAQSLDEMAKQSVFVRQHLKYLSSKNVVSVYAGTKHYCPGYYSSTNHHSISAKVKRSYSEQLTRLMKASGFGAAAINHCLQNSGFVIENGRLQDHPKNTVYRGRGLTGILMVRDTKTGQMTESPIVLELQSFDDRVRTVFDQQARSVCGMTSAGFNLVDLKCSAYGKLGGILTYQSKGRALIEASNARYKMLIVTRRPVSFVRRTFARIYK
jgi:hypothetical protein